MRRGAYDEAARTISALSGIIGAMESAYNDVLQEERREEEARRAEARRREEARRAEARSREEAKRAEERRREEAKRGSGAQVVEFVGRLQLGKRQLLLGRIQLEQEQEFIRRLELVEVGAVRRIRLCTGSKVRMHSLLRGETRSTRSISHSEW